MILVLMVAGIAFWLRGRPDRHLAEAARLVDTGKPAEALAWLAVPETTPATRDRALLLRARVALDLGQPSDAVGPLNRVDDRGRHAIDADYWKARTLFAVKNHKLAIAWFRRVLERRPDDVEALRWLAAAAYEVGDWRTAFASLERVTRLRPDDARAWRTLGLLLREESHYDLDRARVAYETTLSLDPDQPQARLELADVLMKLGRYPEAENQLARCQGNVPEPARLDLLAQCLLARGDLDAARALVKNAPSGLPDHPGFLSQQAALALVDRRFDEALGYLDRAVAADPFNPKWLYQRNQALRGLGRTVEADRDLTRAIELNGGLAEMARLNARATALPDDPEVRYALAQICSRLGKTDLAAYWQRAAMACDVGPTPKRETPSLAPPR